LIALTAPAAGARTSSVTIVTPGSSRDSPCLPTLAHTVPNGPQWAHETKHDGFQFICRRDGDAPRRSSDDSQARHGPPDECGRFGMRGLDVGYLNYACRHQLVA
jgi:hypothetical protein